MTAMVVPLFIIVTFVIVIAIWLLTIERRLARLKRQAEEDRRAAFADRLLTPLVCSLSDLAPRTKTERRARR